MVASAVSSNSRKVDHDAIRFCAPPIDQNERPQEVENLPALTKGPLFRWDFIRRIAGVMKTPVHIHESVSHLRVFARRLELETLQELKNSSRIPSWISDTSKNHSPNHSPSRRARVMPLLRMCAMPGAAIEAGQRSNQRRFLAIFELSNWNRELIPCILLILTCTNDCSSCLHSIPGSCKVIA